MNKITKTNYAWTKEDEEMLLKYNDYCVGNLIGHKKGHQCTFLPYTINIGAKLYLDIEERNGALKNQMTAYYHKVGPKCGTPFKVYMNNVFYYGYLTDIAEVMTDTVYYITIDKMKAKYRTLGFTFTDWWISNVGIFNNEPMIIDFDSSYFHCNNNTIEIA